MTNAPDLNSAYALETPEDSVRLYRKWAQTYDADFANASHYVLHEEVARNYAMLGGFGPVLDVGAGTGLCGAALRARGIDPVDGTDISPEMLDVARGKDVYRTLFTSDILQGFDVPTATYQGAVSSGTFTNGHVGPDGIDAMLDVVRPCGWIVLSVNAQHYVTAGFEAKMAQLEPHIRNPSHTEVAIYGPEATGPHAKDIALIVAFTKA